jgi:hypothetical protein
MLLLPKGTAKLRWGGGGRENLLFRVQCSSIRVQRSSVGCSVAQKGKAKLRRMQRSSEGCSLAQKGAA